MEYGSGANAKIIYDCMEDNSPFYDKTKGESYLEESEAVDLPTDEVL